MKHLEFEYGRALKGRHLDASPFGVVPAEEYGKTDRQVFLVLIRCLAAFRPLLPEAEESLFTAKEHAVFRQCKAGAVATH